jgi:hypothetical protein
MLVALADQRIALPVPDLTTLFNMPWALANRSSTRDLPTSVATACIPLTALPLASQALVKIAAHRFISIDMPVDCLMAHRDFRCDLFGAPLLLQIEFNRKPIRICNLSSITAIERPIFCQTACLSRSITSQNPNCG